MKNYFLSLLAVLALFSCSKDDPQPEMKVEGKWTLSTTEYKMESLLGDKIDETINFAGINAFIDLKADGKLSTNLIMASEVQDILAVGRTYESTYEVKNNQLILQIYDEDFEDYIPVPFNITTNSSSSLVLTLTKPELAIIAKKFDELEGTQTYSQMLAFITSIEVKMSFTK